MLLFSAIGMSMFGGNINSKTPEEQVKLIGIDSGSAPSPNSLVLNFNDYYCAMYALFMIFCCGWGGFDTNSMYNNPAYDKRVAFEYFFILYFVIANLCLMNVVQSFFIDQVCGATSHDAVCVGGTEGCDEEALSDQPEGGEIELVENGPLITAEIDLPEVEVEVEVDAGVAVDLDIGAPDIEIEVGAPDMEVEMDAPEMEVEVEVGLEVDVDVGGEE